MDGEAIRRLEEMALKADIKEKDGVAYVSGNYKPLGVVHDDTVRFTTLQSLCDYIKFNPQGQDFNNTIIVINPDFTVSLLSAPDKLDGQRTVIAYAKRHDTDGFTFGKQYDMESFVVALKSKFVKADSDWETVFNVVRKVRIEDGVVIDDSGMFQTITMKTGVSSASVRSQTVQTDFSLRPYRIFPECEQPKSVFFVRLQGSKEEGVYVSLHETDGGAWKNEAAKLIQAYIVERIAPVDRPEAQIHVFC